MIKLSKKAHIAVSLQTSAANSRGAPEYKTEKELMAIVHPYMTGMAIKPGRTGSSCKRKVVYVLDCDAISLFLQHFSQGHQPQANNAITASDALLTDIAISEYVAYVTRCAVQLYRLRTDAS